MNVKFLFKLTITLIVIIGFGCKEKNSSSAPITVNQNGEITLYGENIPFENLKLLLVDTLEKMPSIADDIEIKYEGEVLMGMRGEIETVVAEAIAEAKAAQKIARIETVLFTKAKGTDCDQVDTLRTNCATIDFQYPLLIRGSEALKLSVEKWVNNYLISILTGGSTEENVSATNLDEGTKIFFDTHETYQGSVMYGGFEADCRYDILLNNEKYLTLAFDGYTFQGGAHGSPSAAVATFDVQSGKLLTWEDLITDQAAVTKIAEMEFRAERHDVFTDGFDFDDIFTFKLPENYGLVNGGIYFHYPPYEVTPYAMGSTAFMLPFSALDKFMKIDWRNELVDEPTDSGGSQDHPDLIAINDVIHGFYKWYAEFQNDPAGEINYTTEKNNHLALDLPKLKEYLSLIKASGYISDVLIDNEIAALKACEKLWKNESLDEPPSCLDYDRFFCAQDWDINFWTQAPITAKGLGTQLATAIMSDGEGENLQAQKFDLQKEKGKWLITKIYCE